MQKSIRKLNTGESFEYRVGDRIHIKLNSPKSGKLVTVRGRLLSFNEDGDEANLVLDTPSLQRAGFQYKAPHHLTRPLSCFSVVEPGRWTAPI